MKRYRIKAWGHPTAPDLDYESDTNDVGWLVFEYPYISTTSQIVVPLARVLDEIKE